MVGPALDDKEGKEMSGAWKCDICKSLYEHDENTCAPVHIALKGMGQKWMKLKAVLYIENLDPNVDTLDLCANCTTKALEHIVAQLQ